MDKYFQMPHAKLLLDGEATLGFIDCPFLVLSWAMQSGESLLSAVHLHCVGVMIPWVAMRLPLWVLQLGNINSGPVLPLAAQQQRSYARI